MRNRYAAYESSTGVVYVRPIRRYGFWAFIFDCLMTAFTGGFWLIWIFIRELRNRR